jgi:hypothetical protein
MALAFVDILERYHHYRDEFVHYIARITCHETWVSSVNVETKGQSMQRMHTHSPNKPKKFEQIPVAGMLMAIGFCDRKVVLMLEFMQ